MADGYLGRVLATSMIGSSPRWGATIDPGLEWILDRDQGATMLTIPVGHALDMMRTVLGDPVELVATTGVLRPTVVHTGTGAALPKTSEDQIAVSGTLAGGAVFDVHYRGGPTGGTQFLWEILGTDGELRITSSSGHVQRGSDMQIHGARTGQPWERLAVPERYDLFPGLADTAAHSVAHSYARIVDALRGRRRDTTSRRSPTRSPCTASSRACVRRRRPGRARPRRGSHGDGPRYDSLRRENS